MSKAREIADLLDSSGKVTADDLDVGAIGGRRNLIINGAMQVAQRGTSFTGVTSTTYSVDRWQWLHNSGTFSLSQAGDGPSGFPTCYSMSCTSTGTTSSSQLFRQRFEGQNTYHLANGTPDAKTTTLSFWVKSNSVGTYPVLVVHHSSLQRHFVMTYTINQADTWEKKTFTIAGDTNGASINNTTMEMSLDFMLSGSNGGATEATEVWKARDIQAASNLQTAPAINGATGRYWKITGIQWELGSVATPFEHRSYGEELALCKRYYEVLNVFDGDASAICNISFYNSTNVYGIIKWAVEKRVTPTVSLPPASALRVYRNGGSTFPTARYADMPDKHGFRISAVGITGGVINGAGWIQANTVITSPLAADAEL